MEEAAAVGHCEDGKTVTEIPCMDKSSEQKLPSLLGN